MMTRLSCNGFVLLCSLLIVSCNTGKQVASDTSATNDNIDDIESMEGSDLRGDLRYVFYNVENLFDTEDDSLTRDNEFLPNGLKGWSEERYNDKLRKIFKVLVNVGGWELPDLIALCEVENRDVLEDLISKTPLSKG